MTDELEPLAEVARFTKDIEIRYVECDQQGIVYNAHYLTFVDFALDHWVRSLPVEGAGESPWVTTWDVMLKRASIDWHGPARWPETLSVHCGVSRWGRTSFDVSYRLRVGDRRVADLVITYVSVDSATHEPMVTPPEVVVAMGETVMVPTGLVGHH
ncbi:MAG: hypothetical protein GY812_05750 [Actinomycetia bacterium]|nr:hypothetical protein [Actinomycetes bacterium]